MLARESAASFADRFPATAVVALLQAKLAQSFLSKADWNAVGSPIQYAEKCRF